MAKSVNSEYNHYEKILICLDVNSIWIARIQKDINEDYEKQEGTYLLEREDINKFDYVTTYMSPHGRKLGGILTLDGLKKLLEEDDFENWDVFEFDSIDKILEILDGGFGINTFNNEVN